MGKKSVSQKTKQEVYRKHNGVCVSCGVECIPTKDEWEQRYYERVPAYVAPGMKPGFHIKRKPDAPDEATELAEKRRIAHIDHIVPRNSGGSNDTSNLQLMCAYCNMSKNDKSPEEFARHQHMKTIQPEVVAKLARVSGRPVEDWMFDVKRIYTAEYKRTAWLLEMLSVITGTNHEAESWDQTKEVA